MKKGDKVRCIDENCCGAWSSIQCGKTYIVEYEKEIQQKPGVKLEEMNGVYYQSRFEVVESSPPSLEDDIKKATSMLGKKLFIKRNNTMFTPTGLVVHTARPKQGGIDGTSWWVCSEFDKVGYVVVLTGAHIHAPVVEVELLPDMIEVPLTDDYIAKVYVDKVVVGCQTITKETFDKVSAAFESLNTNS